MLKKSKNMKKTNSKKTIKFRFGYLLGFFLLLLAIAAVYLTIVTSAAGAQLSYLEEEEERLNEENTQLKNRLVSSTSLSEIEEKAAQLGLKKAEKIIYISQEDTFAKLP